MKTWEKNIRRVEPYVPGEQPKVKDVVKLNTNENPYPPTPKVHEAAERMNINDCLLYTSPSPRDA
mgnify:CR=1 FL=1